MDSQQPINRELPPSAVGVALIDLEGQFIQADSAFCAFLGFTQSELLFRTSLSLTFSEDRGNYMDQMQKLAAGVLSKFIEEKRYLKKDGSVVWARDTVTILRGIQNRPARLVVSSEDITQRKHMEREHEALVAIIEHSSDFIGLMSIDQCAVFVNRAGQQMVGFESLEDARRTPLLAYFPDEDRDYILKTVMALVVETGSWAGEIRFKHRLTEKITPTHAQLFLIPSAKSDLPGTVACVARDITEQKAAALKTWEWNKELETRVAARTEELMRTQGVLAQARKLEALGRLSGGVAHDFNNLMTGILGIAEDMRDQFEPQSSYRNDFQEIITAAQKATALTRQLLVFGQRQVVVEKVININTVIVDLNRFFDRISEEDVKVTTFFDPTVGNIKMDQSQLEQVIINLLLNARDAMPAGGQIQISTSNQDIDDGQSGRDSNIAPGAYVLFTVSDTGIGMSNDVLARVFEPFFTTKEHGKGTGLGLATVYGIAKQCGGGITVESTPGKGTTFRVYFPRVSLLTQTERRASERPGATGGSETILVVEDEDIMRHMAKRVLEKKGYKVVEAQNAEEALHKFKEKSVDMLITDVVMPGMNGRELVASLHQERPKLPVLFMSGHSAEIIRNRGVIDPHINFIEKSFNSDIFCRKVRQVLDANLDATSA